jgi:N-acylneuraminate cytidylyltransferase
MGKITAIIPVRAGSRRLPNKNILPFGDSNLLVHKIRQLKSVKYIDNIVVSTDSQEMIEMAKRENVDYQLRPIEYIAKNIDTDILIWAPCVCPIVAPETYTSAIEKFLNLSPEYDGVVSAKLLKEYIYGENSPVNFTVAHHVPSQLLPNWHIIVNGFFIANKCDMINWKFVYGKKPYLYEVSKYEAIDIDDKLDFKFAQIAYDVVREK